MKHPPRHTPQPAQLALSEQPDCPATAPPDARHTRQCELDWRGLAFAEARAPGAQAV